MKARELIFRLQWSTPLKGIFPFKTSDLVPQSNYFDVLDCCAIRDGFTKGYESNAPSQGSNCKNGG